MLPSICITFLVMDVLIVCVRVCLFDFRLFECRTIRLAFVTFSILCFRIASFCVLSRCFVFVELLFVICVRGKVNKKSKCLLDRNHLQFYDRYACRIQLTSFAICSRVILFWFDGLVVRHFCAQLFVWIRIRREEKITWALNDSMISINLLTICLFIFFKFFFCDQNVLR